MENEASRWRGTPLDMRDNLDPHDVREVVIQYLNGDEDVFTPKRRERFESYELHQMGTYIDAMAAAIRKGSRR
jgi:hypothetical protein